MRRDSWPLLKIVLVKITSGVVVAGDVSYTWVARCCRIVRTGAVWVVHVIILRLEVHVLLLGYCLSVVRETVAPMSGRFRYRVMQSGLSLGLIRYTV